MGTEDAATVTTASTSRLVRSLALCAGIVFACHAANAQNECTALGLRAIGLTNEDGVAHQVLCWDKQQAQACSPATGSCTSAIAAQPAVHAVESAAPLPASTPVVTAVAPLPMPTPVLSRVAFSSRPADDLSSPPLQAGADSSSDEPQAHIADDENHVKPQPPIDDQQSQSGSQIIVRVPEKPTSAPNPAAPKSAAKPETIEVVPESTTIRTLPVAVAARPADTAAQISNLQPLAPRRQIAGQADVALQGYYQWGSGQNLADTTGTSLKFQNFFPSIGLLTASFEGYGSQGDFRLGENFARLGGVSMLGRHWDFAGGDFHVPLNTVDPTFTNIYTPELNARGFAVDISSTHREIRIFGGVETLLQGPRVPFRAPAPQRVFGATAQQKLGSVQLGLRYLHTSSSESQVTNDAAYFPAGRRFLSGDSLTAQALYHPIKSFRFFAEGTASRAERQDDTPQTPHTFSFLAGPELNTKMLTVRVNYVYQGSSYLPLIGYYAGDREGPFGEVRFRPIKTVEMFASASKYANNLDHDPSVPTYHVTGYSGGISATLPWRFSASAQASAVELASSPAANSNEAGLMRNQQISFSLSRPIGRHTVRASAFELKNRTNLIDSTQRLAELEDMFTWKSLVVGGAARLQKSAGMDARNSVFYRGTVRFNIRSFSVYGTVEAGNDLVNKSLLATNSLNSTVIGASAPLFRGWSLQMEAFRNNLTTDLNPASIFVLEGRGVDVPMVLSSLNQWSIFFRISKQLRWGAATPAETMEQYTARQIPLVGTIEGMVSQNLIAGPRGAKGIPVRLDGYRLAFTDASGYFQFNEVAEGVHKVGPALEELPADVELDGLASADVGVAPRLRSRIDFAVAPLLSVSGKITAPKGVVLENVVVRAHPSNRYTTPDPDGYFSLANLREGTYDISIDRDSLPEDVVITSAPSLMVNLQVDAEPASADFQLAIEHHELPVQRVIEQRIDLGSGGRLQQKEKDKR